MTGLGWLCALAVAAAALGLGFWQRRRIQALTLELARMAARRADAEELLRGEAVNFQTILRSMHEGVMVVDSQRVIRFVNPAFRSFFPTGSEPVGATVPEILRAAECEIVDAVMQTGAGTEGEVTRADARQPRHFAVSAMPLRETNGQPGVVVIFRDISRLRQLEDVRKEFVANVSHELRTPLSIFQGYLETLLDSPDLSAREAGPMLQVMNKHSRRLNALVEDLLILARLESRDETLHLAPLDMETFLRESVADWSLRCAEKKITLTAEVPPGLPPIPADAFRLEQVLSNLIDNAIKYTEPGGRVTVRALAADPDIEIRVEDTGLGIPPTELPRIFERFYRADKARSREHGGTGLGLSIVKHIVLAHGGTVRAESTHGQGTSIIIRLPLKPAPGAAVAAP